MFIIDVEVLLSTGGLGPLALGTPGAALDQTLGPPDATLDAKGGLELRRFGRLEVQLRRGVVDSILLSTARTPAPEHSNVSYENLGRFLEIDEATAHATVASLGLHLAVVSSLTSAYQTTLGIAETNVFLCFNEHSLERIYVAAAPAQTPPSRSRPR